MDSFHELMGLYDLSNLPAEIRKEREIRRWREIMAQQRYEQDDLPGFLDAEAQARESDIDRETYIRHKQRLAMKWFAYYKKATKASKQPLIRQYNMIASMVGKAKDGRC